MRRIALNRSQLPKPRKTPAAQSDSYGQGASKAGQQGKAPPVSFDPLQLLDPADHSKVKYVSSYQPLSAEEIKYYQMYLAWYLRTPAKPDLMAFIPRAKCVETYNKKLLEYLWKELETPSSGEPDATLRQELITSLKERETRKKYIQRELLKLADLELYGLVDRAGAFDVLLQLARLLAHLPKEQLFPTASKLDQDFAAGEVEKGSKAGWPKGNDLGWEAIITTTPVDEKEANKAGDSPVGFLKKEHIDQAIAVFLNKQQIEDLKVAWDPANDKPADSPPGKKLKAKWQLDQTQFQHDIYTVGKEISPEEVSQQKQESILKMAEMGFLSAASLMKLYEPPLLMAPSSIMLMPDLSGGKCHHDDGLRWETDEEVAERLLKNLVQYGGYIPASGEFAKSELDSNRRRVPR